MDKDTKKKVLIGLGVIVGLGMLGNGNKEVTQEEVTQEQPTAVQQEAVVQEQQKPKEAVVVNPSDSKVQDSEFSIDITDVEVRGNKLVIWYNYNNESEEEQTPIYKVAFNSYQAGVQLDGLSFSRDNYKDQDTILGGYSNEGLQDMMEITNLEEKVLIRVEPWVDFSDTILAEFEYNPSSDELVRIK